MKKDIHPKYYPKTKVTCACGNEFVTGSTEEELRIEICSACHPLYTGKQKLVDTARRVEKYKEKQVRVNALKEKRKSNVGKKAKRSVHKSVKKDK